MRLVFILRTIFLLLSVAILTVNMAIAEPQAASELESTELTWKQLASLPDRHGFAGPFVGVSHGALIVAGGANFPDKPVWEGGKKVWHDGVFVLEKAKGKWKMGFRLPRALGYGVSVTTPKGVLCIGGSDADRHYADAFLLEWVKGKIKLTEFPPLPVTLANAAGAIVGNIVYVAGGTTSPTAATAERSFYSLDISKPNATWQTLDPWPGVGRMLSVAAATKDSFYLFSGASLAAAVDGSAKRTYLTDAFRFQPGKEWSKIADLPKPVLAAPSPAAIVDGSKILVFGGDDGSKLGFNPVEQHPGFSNKILSFDSRHNTWSEIGELPVSRVTTTLTKWRGGWVVASGEVRPGVRSPEVWFIKSRAGIRN